MLQLKSGRWVCYETSVSRDFYTYSTSSEYSTSPFHSKCSFKTMHALSQLKKILKIFHSNLIIIQRRKMWPSAVGWFFWRVKAPKIECKSKGLFTSRSFYFQFGENTGKIETWNAVPSGSNQSNAEYQTF